MIKAAFTRQRSVQKRGNVCVFRCSVLAVYTTPFCMECGCGVFRRARSSTLLFACIHEPKRKKKLFVNRCCLTTLPSILCKYKGRGTLIQKVTRAFSCLRFRSLHFGLRFHKSPFYPCVFIVLV